MKPQSDEPASRRIQILREDVSKKIAAGEVIDRPFSVVRELLDNSIDAGADSVDVYIEGGGIGRISVVDNGAGMSREDLLLCSQRHATSKIREEKDLYRVRSLGFRGEALASVAACSRLEIVSRERAGGREEGQTEAVPAHRLRVEGGKRLGVEQWRGNPGTVVTVSNLFYNLPVRRKFLKSAAGETGMCRQTFLEKAVAHPEISFRFFSDGKLKTYLPPQEQKQRVASAFGLQAAHLSLLEGEQTGLGLRIVAARPEINRRDRRLIQIYVNRRRIFEYSLVHAVEHSYGAYLPGGQYPVAFLFLELDPELVDFNIHPAKREARFQDLPALHRLITSALVEHLTRFDLKAPRLPDRAEAGRAEAGGEFSFPEGRPAGGVDIFSSGHGSSRPAAMHEFPVERLPRAPVRPAGQERSAAGSGAGSVAEPGVEPEADGQAGRGAAAAQPLYRGQLFRLFLLVEYGSSLYIVDQHAAHERILFEQLKSAGPSSQELLMPIRLEIGRDSARLVAGREELFQRLGIRVEAGDDGTYEITALHEALISIEEESLVRALLLEKGSVDELVDNVFSLAACRLAVKEGRELDPLTATELVQRTFQLANARCPHGRPIWFEVTEQQLLRQVGRS